MMGDEARPTQGKDREIEELERELSEAQATIEVLRTAVGGKSKPLRTPTMSDDQRL